MKAKLRSLAQRIKERWRTLRGDAEVTLKSAEEIDSVEDAWSEELPSNGESQEVDAEQIGEEVTAGDVPIEQSVEEVAQQEEQPKRGMVHRAKRTKTRMTEDPLMERQQNQGNEYAYQEDVKQFNKE